MRYWSNAFMTAGAAMVATCPFSDDWQSGAFFGFVLLFIGALLDGLLKPITQKGRGRK